MVNGPFASDCDFTVVPQTRMRFFLPFAKQSAAGVCPLKPVAPKTSISLRIDVDVLEWFKSQGAGYQTKMNAVLKSLQGSIRLIDPPVPLFRAESFERYLGFTGRYWHASASLPVEVVDKGAGFMPAPFFIPAHRHIAHRSCVHVICAHEEYHPVPGRRSH